jgi:putative transposase
MGTKGFSSYKINDQNAIYFLTFATVNWVDIFTRRIYRDILVESLAYCQKNKGLELFSWVIMNNHVHLVARASKEFKLSDILRDLKKFTSIKIIGAIKEHPESRREWLLEHFKNAGTNNPKNEIYQVWRNDNHPVILYSPKVLEQKINYIHNNPVEA